jgi:hypothetical protein
MRRNTSNRLGIVTDALVALAAFGLLLLPSSQPALLETSMAQGAVLDMDPSASPLQVRAAPIPPISGKLLLVDTPSRTFRVAGWGKTLFTAPPEVDLGELNGQVVRVEFDDEGYVSAVRRMRAVSGSG